MARVSARFEDVFSDLVRSLGFDPITITDAERTALLRHFNAGYRAAWIFGGVAWEDSWDEGELTVTDGYVSYEDLDNAHTFALWTADPRRCGASYVEATTAKRGVFVGECHAVVYGFWRPPCPQFSGTDPDADVIAILADAAITFAQAEYWRAAGQYETGGQRRADAKELCDQLAGVEFPRLQSRWWLRRAN